MTLGQLIITLAIVWFIAGSVVALVVGPLLRRQRERMTFSVSSVSTTNDQRYDSL